MQKNNNLTLLDAQQIVVKQHDESNDAQRVIIVGGNGQQIADSIKEALKDIKINVKADVPQQVMKTMSPSIQYERFEVPTIIKEIEYREIEKPIVIEHTKIEYIEKTIVVPEYKIVEIEKQVILKEQQNFPKILTWLFIGQLLLNILNILHK